MIYFINICNICPYRFSFIDFFLLIDTGIRIENQKNLVIRTIRHKSKTIISDWSKQIQIGVANK